MWLEMVCVYVYECVYTRNGVCVCECVYTRDGVCVCMSVHIN